MGQVTVRVGGFSHPVSCEDGQEGHLLNLAAEVDRNVGAVRAMGGQYAAAQDASTVRLQVPPKYQGNIVGLVPSPDIGECLDATMAHLDVPRV